VKISEITDKNKVWNSLNDFKLNNIDREYKTIIKVFELATRLKRQTLSDKLKFMIKKLIEDIDLILMTKYPDKYDPDIVKIKSELELYKNTLLNMHEQLG
jgi:hypothetical protein